MESVYRFGEESANCGKIAFTFGRGKRVASRLKDLGCFSLGEKKGALTPDLCNQHKKPERTPMLPDQATSKNLWRATREIKGFE